MINNNKHLWFTLIELLVSISIFSIIMVSILSIYISSTGISQNSEANRVLQENLKNIFTHISQDIRTNDIVWVSPSALDDCNTRTNGKNHIVASKLCTTDNEYYLAKKQEVTDEYLRVEENSCSDIVDQCFLVKKTNGKAFPITNNLVSIKELRFVLSNQAPKKVTLNILMQPAARKGLKSEYIKNNTLYFQTTIAQRPF